VPNLAALRHIVRVDRGLKGGKRRHHLQMSGQAKISRRTRTSCALSVAHGDGDDAWRRGNSTQSVISHSQ
jgi:hypothetical protein